MPRGTDGMIADPDWRPRRWNELLAGCLWLGRMIDKGRRKIASEAAGADLMNGYLFGNSDYADGFLLKFLGVGDRRVLEILREQPDDTAAATAIIAASERSAAEIDRWNALFKLINAPFIAMWDADEGHLPPGPGASALKGFYNAIMMPPVNLAFRLMESMRRKS